MNSYFLFLALFCNKPIIENKTEFPWNENDQWNLDQAKGGCYKFYPKSPCMKKFIKSGKQDYKAVCGKENS